jgi:multicomponent Na+:H+ antiporter subunit E
MISLFLLNILLAMLWMLMCDAFDMWTLASGFVLGYLLLGLISRGTPYEGYGRKGRQLFSFAVYFVRILIVANLQVAWEILTPGYQMQPRMIRYSVEGLSDLQITALASSITLTPGTLSADISDDKRWLYIHCMYAQDRDKAVRDLDELRDRLMKEVFG